MKTDTNEVSEKELHQAATSWEHLRQGQLVSYKEIENMIKFIGPKTLAR